MTTVGAAIQEPEVGRASSVDDMRSAMTRFTFSIIEGPNAGHSCGGWRIWTNNEDTYITAKSIGHAWKVSLHGDRCWRMAATKEHVENSPAPLVASRDEVVFKFTPTTFDEHGVRLAFVVAVLRGALRPEQLHNKESQLRVEDRWDRITKASVWMTEVGITDLQVDRRIAGPLPLASGRNVWVSAGSEPIAPTDPEPIPATSIIRPMRPEVDDVNCPGLMVVGAHLG